MLNVDKYREAIMSEGADAARLDCHIAALRGVGTVACAHSLCKMCMQESFKWLFSEHELPLLENGDGLKPGDWIMVSDDGVTWYKHRFVCYYNAMFFVTGDVWSKSFDENGTKITGWKQARLPEEGE